MKIASGVRVVDGPHFEAQGMRLAVGQLQEKSSIVSDLSVCGRILLSILCCSGEIMTATTTASDSTASLESCSETSQSNIESDDRTGKPRCPSSERRQCDR